MPERYFKFTYVGAHNLTLKEEMAMLDELDAIFDKYIQDPDRWSSYGTFDYDIEKEISGVLR